MGRISLQNIASKVFIWQRVNHAVFFARNIVLAWFISPKEQGLFATGLNLTLYFTLFTTFEFRTAMLVSKDPSKDVWNTQWSTEFLLSLIALGLGLLATPFMLGTREWPVVLSLLGLLLTSAIEASASSHLYTVEKMMRFPFLAALRTVVNLIAFGVCIVLAKLGWGWKAMVADRLISAIMIATTLWMSSGLKVRFQFQREHLRYLYGFTNILFFCGLVMKVSTGFDMYAVGRWLDPASAGLYQMAIKWALIPMEIGGGFLAVMALSWYSSHAHEGTESLRQSYCQITSHLVRFCTWVAVCLALFLPELFRWVYKPEWNLVPQLYLFLIPYVLARPFYQNCFQILQVMRQYWFLLGVSVFHACSAVLLTLLALKWSLPGITIAAGASMLLSYLLLEQKICRLLKIDPRPLFLKPLLAGLTVILGAQLASQLFPQPGTWLAIKSMIAILYTLAMYWEWSRAPKWNESPVAERAG